MIAMGAPAVDGEKDLRRKRKRPRGAEDEVRMTFGEHLEELRERLLKSVLFLLGAVVVAMFFYEKLVTFITQPHIRAMRLLGQEAKLMPGSYGGPLLAVMKLAFIVALFVSSPFIGYQLWAFVSAGLYRHERRYVVIFAPISFGLFCLGCFFGYFVLVPYALYGLAKSMNLEILSNQYLFSDYLNLVMLLTIMLGVVFQMPLLMVFCSKIGLIEPRTYHKWRRAAIVINVIVAALITPADVVTMIIVAGPMLLLYEVGVACAYLFARPARKPAA